MGYCMSIRTVVLFCSIMTVTFIFGKDFVVCFFKYWYIELFISANNK